MPWVKSKETLSARNDPLFIIESNKSANSGKFFNRPRNNISAEIKLLLYG
jgi:hypothetical protein